MLEPGGERGWVVEGDEGFEKKGGGAVFVRKQRSGTGPFCKRSSQATCLPRNLGAPMS